MGMSLKDKSKGGNIRLAMVLSGVVLGMVGLAFASVPLYRIFCQVTGIGGTTQVAETLPDAPIARKIAVRFSANVDPALPWRFKPKTKEVSLQVGEQGLVYYEAENLAKTPITGRATFNVTPLKAGMYFTKIHCFCFDEQTLAAGEKVDMGVNFFVDPAIAEDPNLDDVQTITLSYTFFRDPDDLERQEETQQLSHRGDGVSDAAIALEVN
ncbi:cytochrome c oxidase assembly protein [Limibacillus halophilus]|jgi:cytochrome c oxidase assembly protein subunit 11|nr:cytochrome c oxidase assembly protein [Limibacillus halophilus]